MTSDLIEAVMKEKIFFAGARRLLNVTGSPTDGKSGSDWLQSTSRLGRPKPDKNDPLALLLLLVALKVEPGGRGAQGE